MGELKLTIIGVVLSVIFVQIITLGFIYSGLMDWLFSFNFIIGLNLYILIVMPLILGFVEALTKLLQFLSDL